MSTASQAFGRDSHQDYVIAPFWTYMLPGSVGFEVHDQYSSSGVDLKNTVNNFLSRALGVSLVSVTSLLIVEWKGMKQPRSDDHYHENVVC